MPGIPYDPGVWPRGNLTPVAGILHRTIGHWAGDYNIGKHGRGPTDPDMTGFHFLIGQNKDQWVQFYSTIVRCNHAAGANTWAIGIEFSGQNFEPLTPWQLDRGAAVIQWVSATHMIPATWYDGPRIGESRGWRGHVSVLTTPQYEHVDTVTRAEFQIMSGTSIPLPSPSPSPSPIPPPPFPFSPRKSTMVLNPDAPTNPNGTEQYWDIIGKSIVGFNGAPIQGGHVGYGITAVDVPSSDVLTGLGIKGNVLIATCNHDGGTFTYRWK